MNSNGMTQNELKKRHPLQIEKIDTFQTNGLSEQAAKDHLETPEGKLFRNKLIEADINTPINEIDKRAIGILRSGLDLPRIETINEPLVKIVPRGAPIPPYSPFFAKQSEFKEIHP